MTRPAARVTIPRPSATAPRAARTTGTRPVAPANGARSEAPPAPASATVVTARKPVPPSTRPAAPPSIKPAAPASVAPRAPASAKPAAPASVAPRAPASAKPAAPASVAPRAPASVKPAAPASVAPRAPASVKPAAPLAGASAPAEATARGTIPDWPPPSPADATTTPDAAALRAPAATDVDEREAALEKLWSLPPAELSAALEAMSGGARPKLVTMDLDDGDLVEAEPPPQRSVVPMPKPAASHPPPPPSAVLAPPAPIETLRAPAPASMGPRMSAVDPLDMLFDGLYELVFCESSLAAARFCVAKLLQAVEAGAAVMHHLDGATGDYVIAHAEGAHAERVIGARSDSSDWSLDAVARNLKPFSMTYSEESGPRLIARHATLKARRRVLVVPVIVHGRAFAALEIIDPKADLEPRVEAAAIYAASRYADYVREHGVELPPAPASRTQLR